MLLGSNTFIFGTLEVHVYEWGQSWARTPQCFTVPELKQAVIDIILWAGSVLHDQVQQV